MERNDKRTENILKGVVIGLLCLVLLMGGILCLTWGLNVPEQGSVQSQETSAPPPETVKEPAADPTLPVADVPAAEPAEPETEAPTTPVKKDDTASDKKDPVYQWPEEEKPAETKPSKPETTEPSAPAETEPTQPEATEPPVEETVPNVTEPPVEENKALQASGQVNAENNVVMEDTSFSDNGVSAQVPAGVLLEENTTQLVLTITEKDSSDSGVALEDGQAMRPLDVHMEGVSQNNTQPIQVCLGKVLPNGMNIGNVTLYHVENGIANPMTQVLTMTDLDTHNEFYYDPATGDTTVAMASFSEVAVVSEDSAWKGEYDYTWYSADATELTIANADQLAAFGRIVSGYEVPTDVVLPTDEEGNRYDSFTDKTVKLTADVNLADKESENNENLIFYPIGYYYDADKDDDGTADDPYSTVYSFEGTFDGQGHTVANFYQNTWEMKGDDPYYDLSANHYYNDAMGLFGYVVNGKVMNLTVDNFSSDGEFTPTGVIAAYAVNSTFENIAITNCNPRVYNTGNGGIVGIGGNSDDAEDFNLTFTNITIDNTNKISALWGSWDVACGGLVGMFRGAGHVYMTNCHVAAQIDVYNDVCGNYQYYWYRYSGMLVGTNKNMTTDENGYTVPETTKFHAENCTVHFGEWNDYYYCELVANSLASYTHDHQFSRLEQISSIDEIKSGDTWTKTGNFLLIDGDTKTCYHIVKAEDGTLKQHLHADAGAETSVDVNGDGVIDENDLKEDKQIVYLPFNQLFTGYGWGVKHIPVYNGEDYAFDGVTVLDREVGADSVQKFASTGKTEVTTGETISIGTLFSAVTAYEEEIVPEAIQIAVTDLDETGVTAEFTRNDEDWAAGTLTFTGIGRLKVTIQDYYFCTPTSITLTVSEPADVDKFDLVFENTDKYLYRVGNANTVALGSLFKAKDGAEIGNVTATVTSLDENISVSGTYTANTTDWTQGTIQFSGTGVVKVTITDNNYCTPTELYLEVVDAKNITTATSATANNVVLLNDVSGAFTVSNGYAFYGNGFKVTCSGNGSYGSKALSYGFITVSDGGVLDNVQIICDIFPEAYLYTGEMTADSNGNYPYAYSAVAVTDNSTISNCYIYGARNNIFVGSGNVTIENTVTECGSLSNIQIKSSDAYTVTLDDVTTIQYQTTSSYDTSKKVLGFGIVVGDNESASNAAIKLTGDLKQYNWVTNDDTSVSNTYAKTAIGEALKVTDYQHTINGTTTVNMGIAYLNAQTATITDERDNKSTIPYVLNEITMSGQTGQVYSISASSITAASRYDAETDGVVPYAPVTNRAIRPTVTFTGTQSDALTFTYAYDADEGKWLCKFVADLDNVDGGSYDFTFSSLTVQKYGVNLEFTVKDSAGNTVDKATAIALNQLFTGEYILEISDSLIFGADGTQTGETVTHSCPFVINATKTSIAPPEFTNAGTATAIRLVTSSGGDWRPAYTALTGVSVTYWSASESKEKTADLSTLYNSGTISSNVWTYTCDDYTLTITGGAIHSDGSVITPVVANNTLYFASTNKAFTTGTTSRSIVLTYVFTDKNASTTWNRTETVTYSELSEYDYDSFKNNGTLEEASSSTTPCVTPDTRIILADGSQVRVDALTGDEQLLVWNHTTGAFDAAPIAYIVDHEKQESIREIIHLYFSDGSDIRIIGEHVFFDATLNKYVALDENAADYIGHTFIGISDSNDALTAIQLTDVVTEYEETAVYEVVTYEHLTCFTDGILSTSAYLDPLLNIFDIDPETMAYTPEKVQSDIETYGLYTYADFEGLIEEEAFELYNAKYLKIAVGKGYITWDDILDLIDIYFNVGVTPLQ